jgi:hypothetical protein
MILSNRSVFSGRNFMFFVSSLKNITIRWLPTVILSACLASSAWGAKDSFGTKKAGADEYQKQLMQQIQLVNPTADQLESFRQIMREYFEMRNGATRRISRQGGDIDVRVMRDLRRCARESLEAMSAVLTPEQLVHYERLVEIGNEQYMFNAGLL